MKVCLKVGKNICKEQVDTLLIDMIGKLDMFYGADGKLKYHYNKKSSK